MYPHRIHLHGPWQRIGAAGKLSLPPGQFARFDASEPIHLCRPFRWPTPLMPFERLWFVANCTRPTQVRLNEQLLGKHDNPWTPFERDVTPLVQMSNQLALTIPAGAGVLGPVYLEVRRDVHLRSVVGESLWESDRPRLRLTGRLQGENPGRLSLVVRLDDREVLYEELPAGSVLGVVTPPLEVRRWQPGQSNVLHQIDCQLLDPACVLSQHSFATGFRTVEGVGAGEYRINGTLFKTESIVWEEPLDESATLAQADHAGRVLVLSNPRASLVAARPYLWHHPSVVESSGGVEA